MCLCAFKFMSGHVDNNSVYKASTIFPSLPASYKAIWHHNIFDFLHVYTSDTRRGVLLMYSTQYTGTLA